MDERIAADKSFERFLRDNGIDGALIEASYGGTTRESRLIVAGEVDEVIIDRYGDGRKLALALDSIEHSEDGDQFRRIGLIFVVIEGKKRLLDTVTWNQATEEFVVSVRWEYPYSPDSIQMTVAELRSAMGGKNDPPEITQRIRPVESESARRRARKLFQRLAIKD